MKVSDSLDNVPNENVVTQQVTNQQTDRVTDQLLELLEWLFATKNSRLSLESDDFPPVSDPVRPRRRSGEGEIHLLFCSRHVGCVKD